MRIKNYLSQHKLFYNMLATAVFVIICFTTFNLRAQVTVNPGAGSYATVSAAFTAINAGTHTGAITIAIGANTTEPAAPTVLAASGVGSANYSSIAIYPTVSGVVVQGTSNASRGILEFNGADNITINGNINNGVGTSRDLTIKNLTAVTNAHSVLWFQGTATAPALGCTNIIIKNTILQGNGNAGGSSGTTTYSTGIAFAGTTFPGSTTLGANHQNITISNNQFKQVSNGIHIGNAAGTPVLNLLINDNEVGSATASEYVYYRGMWLSNISGSIIRQNQVYNIKPSLLTQSTDRMGIEITGTSASVTIDRNNIHGIATYGTGGYAGYGINLNGGNNHIVINNLIYDIEGYSWTSQIDCPEGIRLTLGTGHKIYYNSVHLFGQITGTTLRYSAAFVVAATTVTGIDVRNNIFSNRMTATASTTTENMAMWFVAAYPFSTAGNTINNNGLFVTPSSVNHFVGKVGVTAGTTTYQSLGNWQTVSLGDAQSVPVINLNAPFTSNTNLTIPAATSTGCESGGVAIASLGLPNTDYTGVNRPAGAGTAPDMGAYEFEGVAATGCTGTPPAGGTASTTNGSICAGNSTTLAATGYTSDIGIQYNWQSGSAVGGPFTDIGGANTPNTYTTGALNSATYYRLRVTCTNSSLSIFSNVVTITVNNPQLLSTAPASLCGTGTVTLGATPSSGTINWYAASTGGSPIATGTSYTTPVISTTTSYWVTASSGGTTQTSSNGVPTVSTSTQNGGVIFDLNTGVTINSIQVYSLAAGTATITLQNSALTTLYTSPALPITVGTLSTPQTLALGWAVPAGTGYRILVANTGNNLGYSSGAFPAPMGNGVGTIVNGALTTGTTTLNYFVYNINTTSGCESNPRVQVTATVTSAPSISASTTQSLVCSGGNTNLNVSSSNAGYAYTWTPGNLTGASVSVNPASTTTYTVTALDNSGGAFNGCTTLSTVAITAQPSSAIVNASPSSICAASGSSVLSLTPSTYPAGSIQWQNSPNGSVYTDIGGATGNTYSTGTISSSTYYKALIKDGNNAVCIQPVNQIVVGVPTVNSTTPNTRCGTGTTSLQATGSAGATIKWYIASTGGTSIGTGSPFTTPVINNTTTYYAEASTGSAPVNATIGTQTTTTQAGMPFRAGNATAFRTQYLFTVAELTTAGLSAGNWNEFRWTVTTAIGAGSTMGNLTIRVGHTAVNALTATFQPSPSTTVYGPTNYVASASLGDIIFTFATAFNWDGSSNVLIEICHDNPSPSGVSGQVAANTTGFVSVAAVGNVCGTAAGATTQSIRPIIKIAGSTGCASARVGVVATVTPAPAISLTSSTTAICPGGTADLSVSSVNDPSYTYSWTSSPAGFTATGSGPHTVSPTATTKYYVTATDNSGGSNQGCAMIDSVTIINGGTLVAGTVSASQSTLCISGSSNLSLTGASGGANQWQSSTVSSSGPWTNVGTGTNSYATGTITQTTYYRVVTSCNVSSVNSNVLTVTVNNPTLTSTTPATRCGTGQVTLNATTASGTVKWYANSTGGTALATGNSYSPTVSNTTTFYAAASSGGGGTANTGMPAALVTATSGAGTTNFGLVFDVFSAFTLNSVTVYPVSSTSASGTVTVDIINSAGTVLNTVTTNVTGSPGGTVPVVITLNFNVAPGTNLKMRPGFTGISGLLFEPSASAPGGNYGYPYVVPGVLSINTSTLTAAPTNTARNDLYYYFYNWSISSGCESARTAVVATVTPAPAISLVAADLGLCTGGSTTLSVSSTNDPSYTYTWTSNPAGFNQTGNGPFTISPTATTKYYVDALDNSGGSNNGCVIRDSVTITVTGTLVAGTVAASQSTYCNSGSPTLTLTGSQGAIQWQSSTVGVSGPWTNVGTGLATYTPSLTQTTYIQAVVSCQSSSLSSNVVTINVNNPLITSTTPNTRCGAGTVNLLASSSAGTTVNWYAAASGGSPIGSGTTFTTPLISTTTNFYAAANSGGGTTQVSSNGVPTVTTSTQNGGLQFTLNVDVLLNSIQVYSTAAGTATVTLENSANTVLYTSSAQPIVASNLSTPQTLTLGWAIPAGVGYHIKVANTGNALGYASGAFPAPMGNSVGTITSGWLGATTSTLNYFVYNMNTTTGCESARTAVAATVTPSPNISASATFSTPCAGNPTALSVSSVNDPNYTYTWTSTPAGYNQTGSGPFTVTPSVTTIYHVLAVDNTSGTYAGCGAATDITITPTANPLSVSTTSTPPSVCPGGNAQLLATASASGYIMNTSCGAPFIDISSTGTAVSGIGDDTEHNLTIPSFTFNGVAYTTARVGTNGALVFGSTTGDVTLTNAALPSTGNTAGNVFLAPYWDDLDINMGGNIYTQTVGNLYIVQWHNVDHNLFTTGTIRFQIQMNLSNGQISFVYPDVVFGSATYDLGLTCTVGIQFSSTSAIQYSFNTASLSNGQSICFTPNSPAVTYNWSANSNFLSTTTTSNPVAQTVTSSQAYTVVVTQTSTGCTKSSTVNLTVNPPPQPSASSNAPVCAGFPLSLFGDNLASGQTTGNTWSWSGPSYTSSIQNPSVSGTATTANAGTYTLTITNNFGCSSSMTTEVIVNPNPVLSVGTQINVSCNGQSDGEVDLVATIGAPQFSYDLDGLGTLDGIYTGLGAGTYTANVSDDNGCQATPLSVTITEPDVLTVSAGSNTPVCSGTSINLNSTPVGGTLTSVNYSWTGPNGAVPAVQNPTIASATTADGGQYDLTITDAHGCIATANHTVVITASPTAAIDVSGSANKCLGQSATVQLTFTGTGPWTYSVSGSGGPYSGSAPTSPYNVNVTPAAAGTQNYTVTSVGNATCPTGGTGSGTATIYVSTAPPVNTAQPVPAANYACNGSVQLVTVPVIPGQNIRYSWNTGSASSGVLFSTNVGGPFTAGPFQTVSNQVYAQFQNVVGSAYNICVQGINGCGSTNNRCVTIRGTVSVPGTISPPSGVVGCANTTQSYSCGVSGGATQYNWTLSGSPAAISSGQGTQNVTVLFPNGFTSGQLCVTAQLPCGGSSVSAPRCINVSNNPQVPGAMAGPTKVCPGATGVTFSVPSVAGATGYSWTTPAGTTISSGQGSTSITVNFPNPYTTATPVCVTATSACGSSVARCQSVGSNLPNQPQAITGPSTNICNSTVQYSIPVVSGASSYAWSNPSGTTISSGQGSTTILLSIGSSFSTGTLSVTANTTLCTPGISQPRNITLTGKPNTPGTETANPTSWCNGGFVNFGVVSPSPAPTYNWTVSNGTITAGQGTNNIDVTWGTGTGAVNVTAGNSCGTSSIHSQSWTGQGCREEDMSSLEDFTVYPNPAHDKITVRIYVKEQTQFNISLRDISGRIILSEDQGGAAGLNTYDMDLKNFAKGIYMLEVQSSSDTRKTKVVIE